MLTGPFEYKKKYDFLVRLRKKNKGYDVFLVRFPSAFSTGLKKVIMHGVFIIRLENRKRQLLFSTDFR